MDQSVFSPLKSSYKGYKNTHFFLRISDFLCTYERASYGHIKSITRHDGRDAIIALNCQSAVC